MREKIITRENFEEFKKKCLEDILSEDIVYIISNEVLSSILAECQCGTITLEDIGE